MSEQNENRQRLTASIVNTYTKDGEEHRVWTDVGVAWKHKSGEGYNLQIREGLSVHGTIVLLPPRDSNSSKGEAQPAAGDYENPFPDD